jgi:hypothetical protein
MSDDPGFYEKYDDPLRQITTAFPTKQVTQHFYVPVSLFVLVTVIFQ